MLFPGVAISTLDLSDLQSADVTFVAKETDNLGQVSAQMHFFAEPDTQPFCSNESFTTRPITIAAVAWVIGAWTAKARQTSPSVLALVQESVGQPGWAAGNAMGVFISTAEAEQLRRSARTSNPASTGPYLSLGLDRNACAGAVCLNGGQCINLLGGLKCQCNNGATGVYCENGLDDCLSSPCAHGACIDRDLDFSCECEQGWMGLTCSDDVDECATDNGGCHPLAACNNLDGGRACGECPGGYVGDGEGDAGCVNVDECVSGTHDCDPRASCVDTVGSHVCTPFLLDGSLALLEGAGYSNTSGSGPGATSSLSLASSQGGETVALTISNSHSGSFNITAVGTAHRGEGVVSSGPPHTLIACTSFSGAGAGAGAGAEQAYNCTLPAAYGTGLVFWAHFCPLPQLAEPVECGWAVSNDTLSLPTPSITAGTLRQRISDPLPLTAPAELDAVNTQVGQTSALLAVFSDAQSTALTALITPFCSFAVGRARCIQRTSPQQQLRSAGCVLRPTQRPAEIRVRARRRPELPDGCGLHYSARHRVRLSCFCCLHVCNVFTRASVLTKVWDALHRACGPPWLPHLRHRPRHLQLPPATHHHFCVRLRHARRGGHRGLPHGEIFVVGVIFRRRV